ncbi:MAG: hypothetical protein ACP5RO_01015 [Fervidicoccaceae archaeon]
MSATMYTEAKCMSSPCSLIASSAHGSWLFHMGPHRSSIIGLGIMLIGAYS